MASLTGPVGVKNRTQPVANAVADQTTVIGLLALIKPSEGGQLGIWAPPPAPAAPHQCPAPLANAIRSFQDFWAARGEVGKADGVVDKDGKTIRKLNALATGGLVGPGGTDPGVISLRGCGSAAETAAKEVTQDVISPLSAGKFYQQIPQTASIRELLFELRKDNAVYWVGVAVPVGTSDFSQAHVYFHPTVVNGGVVHAKDSDYPTFAGGWYGSMQRYVSMQGGQLAGARRIALIVPFMTMAAVNTKQAPAYMFGSKPTETLNAIMTAVRDEVTPGLAGTVNVARVSVASFSSGLGAMRLFIRTFGDTGIIAETTDFDGPFIKTEPKTITRAPGAVGRVYSQQPPTIAQVGYQYMPAGNFSKLTKFRDKGPHAQIGWMGYYMASLSSVIV